MAWRAPHLMSHRVVTVRSPSQLTSVGCWCRDPTGGRGGVWLRRKSGADHRCGRGDGVSRALTSPWLRLGLLMRVGGCGAAAPSEAKG